jgi:formate hydrogenlyase subunit 3/multisubunit Na+/H+ antiporter MnhD subunit
VSPIPGPLILLALPLAAAVVAYLVRRWAGLAAFVSVVTSGVLAVLCLRLPLDRSAFVLAQEVAFGRPVVIVGRNLVLDPAGQAWLAFAFGLATIFFLLAWRLPQGRAFFAFGLVILTLYSLIVLLETFSLAILVFAMSATPAIFIIQAHHRVPVRGAQRYLLVTVLAVPLLLAAAWMVDQSLLDPERVELARQALLPAGLGFALLLAVFPFGTWMPALAADAPPLATAFAFTAGQAMAVYLAVMFLHVTPWYLGIPATLDVLLFVGLVMVVSGGIMAAVQNDFGRLLGYAALSDLGYLLLAFGAGSSQGTALALLHLVNRSVVITLMAAALAVLRQQASTDVFRRLPIAMMGLMIGGLALAGFPFTAGFPSHWAASRSLAVDHWEWALLLLVSSLGIAIGLLRGLSSALGTAPADVKIHQPVVASIMVLILTAVVIVLGLYPQLFLGPVSGAVEALALF